MEKNSLIRRLLSIIGLLVIAVVAGAASSLLVADSVIGELAATSFYAPSVPARPTTSVNGTRVSDSVRAFVSIYKKRSSSGLGLDKILLPSDRIGAGIVLTTDGWIVFPSALLAGDAPLVAVFNEAPPASFNPTAALRDDATGVAFVKIGAQRLSVAPFGDDSGIHSADPIFLADSSSVAATSVLLPRFLPVSVKADYLESSERLGRRIMVDRNGLPGEAVVNANGETVGLSLGDGTAVPVSFIEQVMRGVFRDGKITRPKLGVRFISLDGLPNAKEAGFAATGALLASSGSIRAVVKGSAAETAGLKEGDVIIAVEHDRIDNKGTLSERLQDYAPGTKVEFTLLRGGQQVKAEVTLK